MKSTTVDGINSGEVMENKFKPYDIYCPFMKSNSTGESLNYWRELCKYRYELRKHDYKLRKGDKCYLCYTKGVKEGTRETLSEFIKKATNEQKTEIGKEFLEMREKDKLTNMRISQIKGVSPAIVQRYINMAIHGRDIIASKNITNGEIWLGMYEMGIPVKKIAKKYSVHESTVRNNMRKAREEREGKE